MGVLFVLLAAAWACSRGAASAGGREPPENLGLHVWKIARGFETTFRAGLPVGTGRNVEKHPIFPNVALREPIGGGLVECTLETRFPRPRQFARPALLFPGIGEFYQIFLNGQLIHDAWGEQAGGLRVQSRYRRNLVVPVPRDVIRDTNILVVRLRGQAPRSFLSHNFVFGLTSAQGVFLGGLEWLQDRADESLKMVLYGAYLFFGLYHLLFFVHRTRERYHLYFGLFSVALSLYLLGFSERSFQLIPDFTLQQRVSYPTQPMAMGLFLLFLNSFFFPPGTHRTFLILTSSANALFAGAMLLSPAPLLQSILPAWYVVAAPQLGYMGYVLVVVLARRMRYARRTAAGLLFGILFVVWDMLDTLTFNTQVRLTEYAHLLVILSLVTVLAQRFLDVHSASERLNLELTDQRNAFARFVPREFLDLLDRTSITSVRLGDHTERELTILVADIRQFGLLAEKMSPSDNFKFLNAYLSRVGPQIRRHNGFIDKYIGDAIMALFQQPEDAIRAAIEMRRSLFSYNEHRTRLGYPAIDVGIGVHTGQLVLGTIGEAERMEGTVISDDVNLAFRLEDTTKLMGAPVIFSVATLQRLSDPTRYQIRFLGKLAMKHRDEPVSIYELLDGLEDEPKTARMASRTEFERAVFAYYAEDFPLATRGFEELQRNNQDDGAVAYYLAECRRKRISA